MPGQRNSNGAARIKKQKKLINSRLMQISLYVDDYVYKNKPISVKNADMYINEVSGYKDKCFEDKRSLQVIEKLTRIMRGIIAEQQESMQGRNEINTIKQAQVESILALPVNVDLTQFTQAINKENIVESRKNVVVILDPSDKSVDIDNHIIKGKKQTYNRSQNDVNLERALSELTINVDNDDDPLSLTHFTPEECSQSILNNFDCMNIVDSGNKALTNDIACIQDFEETIQPAKIKRRRVNDTVNSKYAKTSTTRKKINNVVTNAANTTNILEVLTSIPKKDLKTFPKAVEEKVKMKRGRKPTINKRNTNNENKINYNVFEASASQCRNQIKTSAEKVKRKRVSKAKKNNEVLQETHKQSGLIDVAELEPINLNKKDYNIPDKNSNVIKPIANLMVPQRNRRFDKDKIKATVDKSLNSQSALTKDLTNIYNKETPYDLSWVEGIRYVREIDQEECKPAYFEESFWNDFTLPNDWNDEDFLYT